MTLLADALTREHHEIDGGIEEFVASLRSDDGAPPDTAPLTRAMDALRRHIYLEEDILFPWLEGPSLAMPLMVMYREHGQIWRAMDTLELFLATEARGGAHRDMVVGHCQDLLDLLEKHNSKEEPIIYPHADADLPPAAHEVLREFLDTGELPEGWVCREANS